MVGVSSSHKSLLFFSLSTNHFPPALVHAPLITHTWINDQVEYCQMQRATQRMIRRGEMHKLLIQVYFDFYIILFLNVHFPIYAWHTQATLPIVFLLYNTHFAERDKKNYTSVLLGNTISISFIGYHHAGEKEYSNLRKLLYQAVMC